MTEKFNAAMPYVFMHEGGFNDVEGDNGGATNYGVSLGFLQGIGEDINNDGKIDWLDIKALKKEQAELIYWNNFWKQFYDMMPAKLAIKIFDTAVNTGNIRAHILLQQALNVLMTVTGKQLVVDGLIGKGTLDAINSFQEESILTEFCKQQLKFYCFLVQKNSSQAKFLKGWTYRANWLPK